MPGRSQAPLGSNPSGSKNALVIMISALVVLFLAGGGIYWWLSKDDSGGNAIPGQPVTQQNGNPTTNAGGQNAPGVPAQTAPQADLSRAATYLTEPGLKCTFFVNYPDGMSGIVDRISGQAVPDQSVRVSDVEWASIWVRNMALLFIMWSERMELITSWMHLHLKSIPY